MKFQNEVFPGPGLSKVRTFLFWCLAIVWFCEMLFLGVPFFNRVWLEFWQVAPPIDSQLAAASMITGAVGAPVKGAFFVMAVCGIMSKNPATRTALFISMSLIPPLNVAFPFRYQGFILGPTMVGSVLSVILWVSFFLFKESYKHPDRNPNVSDAGLRPLEWRSIQSWLFGVTSVAISALAFIFLFLPKTALSFSFPCIQGLLNSSHEELPGMIYHSMASGTHLLGLAVGSWIATINQRNTSLRQVMTITNIVFISLFFIFPIRHLIVELGTRCMSLSFLSVFAFLLLVWLIYAAFSYRAKSGPASVLN